MTLTPEEIAGQDLSENRRPELRRTPARRFLLSELGLWGTRSFPGRYTLSLRIMEEHGYVGRNIDPDPRSTRWYAKRRGKEALERWGKSNG